MTTLALALIAGLGMNVGPDEGAARVDRAAGWRTYSGADAPKLWRGYKQPTFPKQGWVAEKGELRQVPPGGGDILTVEQFGDFELSCDFKLDAKANSGIMWRTGESLETAWQTGPEFQLLEDGTYPDKLSPGQYCGALYDLYPPGPGKELKGAGQWNQARIYLRNGQIQHWVNGKKLVDATIFDDAGKPTAEWIARIAASKFKTYPGFGVQAKGSIALQDHGGGVAFRDLKIRDLNAPLPGEIVLFNGRNLDGWEAIVPELSDRKQDPASLWSVKGGVLICKGKDQPGGYIRTTKDYKNYVLKVEWRFNPVTKEVGNSGVLLRMVGADKVWPKSIEAQLESGNAGDFWNIDKVKMTTEKSRLNGRNTKHTHGAERPIGEWNEYEIIVNKGDIVLKVNGEELNRAWDVEEVAGKICLQAEGAEIQFRSIRLAPLD